MRFDPGPFTAEIKARMLAKIKTDVFPELRDQVIKLMGDAVSVRDTIQEAFGQNLLKGVRRAGDRLLGGRRRPDMSTFGRRLGEAGALRLLRVAGADRT